MKHTVFWPLILLAGLGAALPGYPAAPADFRFLAPLTGALTPDTPVRLVLPRQVMAAAKTGFADVRLFDDQGVETPYVIYTQSAPPSYTVVLPVLAYSQEQDGESIILQRPLQAGPVSELSLQTRARNFHKLVRLQASYDQVSWREVTTDALFDFSARLDVRKTTMAFPALDAPYLRLLLKDATPPRSDVAGIQLRYNGLEFVVPGGTSEPFRIDQISGRVGTPQATDDLYDRAIITAPETRSMTPGQTLVLLGRLHLPLARLTLTAENPYYHRRVEVWGADVDQDEAYQQVASGVMYKLPGMVPAETTLQVQLKPYTYVRLNILDGDNPPLRLQQVEIAWLRHHLYFIPAVGRRYTLYAGSEQVRSPVYELQKLLPPRHAALEQAPVAGLDALQPHSGYNPSRAQGSTGQVETVLLTGLVLLLVAGMGWWAYRLYKVVAKPDG